MKKVAVIYDRASTRSQEDNWSRVNARDEGIRIAEYHGFTWEYIKEIGSGTTLSGRPEMMKILDRIAEGEIQIIIVQDLDRLARPTERAVYETIRNIFIEYNVIVYTHNGKYNFADDDSDFVADINMAVAKKESLRTRKRMRRGQVAKAKRGGYVGGALPLGYELLYDNTNKRKKPVGEWTINTDEAEQVKVIFNTIEANGGNLGASAKELNQRFTGKRGGKFTFKTLKQLATNEMFIGLIDNRFTEKPVHNPALQIISVQQFERVQELIKSRERKEYGSMGRYPFTGFIVCGTCGGPMVAANNKGYVTYECINRRTRGKAACSLGKHYGQHLVVEAATTLLADLITQQLELNNILVEAANQYGKTTSEAFLEAAVSGQLATIKKEKANLIDAISKGILADEEAKGKLSNLREEENRLIRERAGINEKATIREEYLKAIEILQGTDIKQLLMKFANEKPMVFRRLLGMIIKPNTLHVRTERQKGTRMWRAVVENYELTETVQQFNVDILHKKSPSFDTIPCPLV